MRVLPLFILMVLITALGGCSKAPDGLKDRVVVDYWEMWTDFEFQAAKDLVDKFNNSQDEIFVNLISVAEIEQKLLIAIAGRNPPDLANLQNSSISQFADKNAIEKLDDLLPSMGIHKEDYIDICWKVCQYEGGTYGLPIVPTTVALHWNKDIFRQAGLDPNKPPKTLEELDGYAKKLTFLKPQGGYDTVGFAPTQPGWWNYAWVWWFGGDWWDGKNITANTKENIEAFKWVQTYSRVYGARALQDFTSGFGPFSWSSDRFTSGKLAMTLQGVWLSRFLQEFAPQLNWSAEALPSTGGKLKNVTMVECNVLVIPKGAKHKNEAARFIAFMQKPENMKYLALKQNKFVPLKIASQMDFTNHPNKEIQLFIELSQSPNAHSVPQIPIWYEYAREIDNAFQFVWLDKKTPEQALDEVQKRIETKWADYCKLKQKRMAVRNDN
ncbi:MAG: ABC transporter substrate-binding protein [Phycisphaerales bacterium]